MSNPTTERGAMQRIIRALKAVGWNVESVYDGAENIPLTDEQEAIKEVMGVDQAHMYFRRDVVTTDAAGKPSTEHESGWIFFVLGNEPDEVANDYTTNLDPTVKTLIRSWW